MLDPKKKFEGFCNKLQTRSSSTRSNASFREITRKESCQEINFPQLLLDLLDFFLVLQWQQ